VSSCHHPHRIDGICLSCGDCLHEVILNHRCYFCGAEGVTTTVVPADVVPASRLARGKDRVGSGD